MTNTILHKGDTVAIPTNDEFPVFFVKVTYEEIMEIAQKKMPPEKPLINPDGTFNHVIS